MTRPRLLDLFCCQGGASMGYYHAGFDVVGVDIDPQPRYPLTFHQGDALKYLLEHYHEFDAFHASPPCQAFTNAQKIQGNEHPDFIQATRAAFELPVDGEFMHVVGNFSGVDQARAAMGMPWATRDGLREAIPPAYTEHIGTQLLAHLEQEAAA